MRNTLYFDIVLYKITFCHNEQYIHNFKYVK